jgi:uncharacterized repeat protein (TIGR02543 family)
MKMKRLLGVLLTLTLMLGLLPGMSLTAYASEFTSLKQGDVLHLGDTINSTTMYQIADGAYLNPNNMPYTLVRANIGMFDITESETGAYYLLKRKSGSFFGAKGSRVDGYDGGYWPVTDTSDGIYVESLNGTNVTFAVHEAPAHTHDFTYSVRGATITATCNADGCTLDDGTEQHKHAVTLTIVKPTLTTYGQTGEGISASATLTGLTDFNTATGLNVQASSIIYWNAKIRDGEYKTDGDQPLTAAPTSAGNYLAKITVNNCIASVGYTIAPITISSVAVTDITAPTATATLDTAAASTTEHVTIAGEGAITWDPVAPQDGKAAYATVYKATVTAAADTNYAFADTVAATVNGQTATVTKNDDGTLGISYTFTKTALNPVTITPTNKSVDYSADGIAIPVDGMFTITEGAGYATYAAENGTGEGTFDAQTGKLTVTKCGTFTVKVSTAATETYAAGAETSATLTVNKADPLSEAVPAELVVCSSDLICVHGTAGQEYIIVLKGTNVTPESWENKTVPDSGNDYLVAFEDLSAATEYDVYTRISETANYKAGDAVNTPVHTTIDYTELDFDSDLVGATLTVRPYPEKNDYTYKWYRDDRTYYDDDSYQSNLTEIAGVQENTYTFTADDCGKYIAVKIFVADSEVGDTDFGPIGYGKVLFDSKGGSEVLPVTGLSYGSNVTKPADPEKEGYSFAGWYEDEEYDEEYLWNFDTDTVMWQETTLYAKWVASEKELPYKDVKEIIAKNNGRKPYYYRHLQFLYDHNIMTGLKPDLFGVGAYLTREQAATLLYRYAGSPAVNSDGNPFPDVKKPSHWAYNAIVWAKANGVITGYTAGPDKGMFGPADDITREQFMLILWRWAKTSGYDITPDSDATYKAVADSNKISTWAVEAVNWGYENGIIGNKSLFKPQDNLTREDAATMLHRYIEVVSNLSKA